MPPKQSIETETVIKSLSSSGHGVGSYSPMMGKVRSIEVPGAVLGDVVRISLRTSSRRGCIGKLIEVVAPSPFRIHPRCLHASACGGCRFQQMEYDQQLRYKAEMISHIFSESSPLIHSIVPCDPPWNHRNKMEFTFSQDRSGQPFLGLYGHGGRGRVIDLKECHLVSGWMISALQAVRTWWQETQLSAFCSRQGTGLLRTLTLREGMNTGEKLLLLTINGGDGEGLSATQKQALLDRLDLSIVLRHQFCVRGVPTYFRSEVLRGSGVIHERLTIGEQSLLFRVSPTAFFQPNTQQAQKLYARCLSLANLNRQSRVLDLCCGTGTLSLIAGLRAGQVVGIDVDAQAIADAQWNAELNGSDHVKFVCGDLAQSMHWEPLLRMRPQVAIVDPPRVGLPRVAISQLINSQIGRIIYVSCNPKTQVEDIRHLLAAGYALTEVHPFDQFPHTLHVENIAVLDRHVAIPL